MSEPIVRVQRYMGRIGLGLWMLLVGCWLPVGVAGETGGGGAGALTSGLMWNRSGLPAVFPLQVKTPIGQDYFLTLVENDTDKTVLAAFIVGGRFFKVLVPPGTFRLRFAAGKKWLGEELLFGAGAKTQQFELPDPLTFAIRGSGTKAGHLVDLTGPIPGVLAAAEVKGQYICQALQLETRRVLAGRLGRDNQDDGRRDALGQRPQRIRTRAVDAVQYAGPNDHRFFFSRYVLRSRFCG